MGTMPSMGSKPKAPRPSKKPKKWSEETRTKFKATLARKAKVRELGREILNGGTRTEREILARLLEVHSIDPAKAWHFANAKGGNYPEMLRAERGEPPVPGPSAAGAARKRPQGAVAPTAPPQARKRAASGVGHGGKLGGIVSQLESLTLMDLGVLHESVELRERTVRVVVFLLAQAAGAKAGD